MRETLITIVLVAAPKAALACPICFGDANAPISIAANKGIWFMLAIVAAMLTAFATFFVYLMRRARLAADADAGHYESHHKGQEGTAQC